MCCALFLIVYPLDNNMELLRKSKTMTRTWCILFLALSPSGYSPSVCLHIFFVSVGSIIDGASHPRSSAPFWVVHPMLHLSFLLLFRNKSFHSDFFNCKQTMTEHSAILRRFQNYCSWAAGGIRSENSLRALVSSFSLFTVYPPHLFLLYALAKVHQFKSEELVRP
jgi:hypothetical protein